MDESLALRVLGPVEVQTATTGDRRPGPRAARWCSPGPPQQRVVLAVLALRAGEIVPAVQLIDALWDGIPPRSAPGSLHALVTRLRRTLAGAGAAIDRRGPGYRLAIEPARIDLCRFRRLARTGREEGDPAAALGALNDALALWRGRPLADVPDTMAVEGMRARLDEEHLSAVQDRADRLLAAGLERDLAAEFPALLADHPLAERLAATSMLALCRCGQRATALRLFRDVRQRLAAELGVEPGAELQRLHSSILAGEIGPAVPLAGPAVPLVRPAVPLAGPGPVVPRQLPAGTPHFAGRSRELTALGELAGHARLTAGPPLIVVISGTAGVGKTSLAVHWAHQVEDQFPDGQLYVNLNGFGPSGDPIPPETAVREVLAGLAVPPGHIPASLTAQAALYRSVLRRRRVLILIDNARDADQVRPLLPGGGGCLALITSRSQLGGLAATEGAAALSLDVLSGPEGHELLTRRLGTGRVTAEPDAVRELGALCARLPLALAIAAARAASFPDRPLAAFTAELRSRPGRLDALATGDPGSSVRDVLSWSYRQLGDETSRMFELLGLHPGPDISAPAAASLAGLPLPAARRTLAELIRAHLLDERIPGRFAFHDLLRAYAAEQALVRRDAADREAAASRVLNHYLHTANRASQLLYPVRDPLCLGPAPAGVQAVRLAARTEAMAWLTAEHQVLLAAAEAATAGPGRIAWQLSVVLSEFLSRQGHWHVLATTQRSALAAARRLGDPFGEACAEHGVGTACHRLQRNALARLHLDRAASLFGRLGERSRQARSLISLGDALAVPGRYGEAWRQTDRALRLYEDIGSRPGQAVALSNLGELAAQLGDYHGALDRCERGIGLHREVGNALGEAHAWETVGYARHHLGDYATAITSYRRALGLLQGSDRPQEAETLIRLGDSHLAADDQAAAGEAWRQALAILGPLHHPAATDLRARLRGLGAAPERGERNPGDDRTKAM